MKGDYLMRFRAMGLIKQEIVMHRDALYLREWRRDKETGIILSAYISVDRVLTGDPAGDLRGAEPGGNHANPDQPKG